MHHSDSLAVQRGALRAAHRDAERERGPGRGATTQTDTLWTEHGWALGSSAVGGIIALILAASLATQLLG